MGNGQMLSSFEDCSPKGYKTKLQRLIVLLI